MVSFPVSCESLNNCSGHGNCSGPNVCTCHAGFKGIACSEGIFDMYIIYPDLFFLKFKGIYIA